ncbi:hypothetical protein QTO34_009315 [Cnephaeus nilssonii]|uniref:Transmembrane protein 98 n=1 Tax=Cnephaeus nilssonii TaxID=3371016 RepID=A0AA40HIB7_CNENI|nr:hypothetical protein QTO34_009315 [Eptesicus nilssonii]
METVVIVAIGVLATIFLASFAALVVVCRQRYCRPRPRDLLQRYDSKPIVDLIGAMETQSEPSELELDDVVITNPHIEAILENEDWIEDASGLMSHCIAILKPQRKADLSHSDRKTCCHDNGLRGQDEDFASVSDIIVVAKRISPRVDDVVKSMYPPLDPKLLDARTTALLLSVSHLVLVTRNACHLTGGLDWVDQSLSAAEEHLEVLREAALASSQRRAPQALRASCRSSRPSSAGWPAADHKGGPAARLSLPLFLSLVPHGSGARLCASYTGEPVRRCLCCSCRWWLASGSLTPQLGETPFTVCTAAL